MVKTTQDVTSISSGQRSLKIPPAEDRDHPGAAEPPTIHFSIPTKTPQKVYCTSEQSQQTSQQTRPDHAWRKKNKRCVTAHGKRTAVSKRYF